MESRNIDIVEIGKRVKLLRIERNMSRKKLAESTGVSSETIKRVENGCNYSMITFLKLAVGLGTSADYLCFGKKNEKSYKFLIDLYENSDPIDFLDILKKLK